MENTKGKAARSVLGRGLSALISSPPVSVAVGNGPAAPLQSALGQVSTPSPVVPFPGVNQDTIQNSANDSFPGHRFLDIDEIQPSTVQPRQDFAEAELKELAESIKSLGVLQPILVRKSKGGAAPYELVAGERRWRASKIAGLAQVPVIIKDIDDLAALEIALVENVQRADLNPVEEALAYQRLMDEFSLNQQDVAEKVGKERASVANAVRLLKLPKDVLDLLRRGELLTGHAKAILSIKDAAAQSSLAKKAVKDGLSVRALESLVAHAIVLDSGHRRAEMNGQASDPTTASINPFPAVIDRLREALGTKVLIKHQRNGRGRIEVEYFSEQELDRLVETICRVQ